MRNRYWFASFLVAFLSGCATKVTKTGPAYPPPIPKTLKFSLPRSRIANLKSLV